jgi:glycosyltransferase involved in cell wall biosynthesis
LSFLPRFPRETEPGHFELLIPMNTNKCIIIPAFNEEKQIASVIESIRKYSAANIVVIDDGSGDMTAEIARKAGAYVICHSFNMGYGVALQTGYKYALASDYEYLLQIDGDGQHDPRYIPALFTFVENRECELVIGSRFLSNVTEQPGIFKLTGIKLFRRIIKVITGERITDPTSGYQCMNRKVFQYFAADSFPCDYPDANIIIVLHRMGFKLAELPVTMMPNPEGRSMHRGLLKISYYFFKVFLSILVVILRKKSSL